MSDQMRVQPFEVLLRWILEEWDRNGSIFGLHRSLFYRPREDAPYTGRVFGHYLTTPIGPAAGPHTQLAQNIVCAWLCGGRFIELKTVQVLDELEIPRPCIDMEDEGYNVEWSQELKLDRSAGEYIKAWALIHILRRLLGLEGRVPLGTVFNMSVGYNLEGIQSLPMTRFMDRLTDASTELAEIRFLLEKKFPRFADVEIPPRLSDNVTLSTMHGCPPDEIERIARYLLEERGLHTTVKLNPTLLGRETVLRILHQDLGFAEIQIPPAVFEHDLQYPQAVALIRNLQEVAGQRGLTFGVKLSNTLAMKNHKHTLPGEEVYMSGRALYPITMNLFLRLAREFDGNLNVSYSAGADALNLPQILAAGAYPVTAVSDLLKPGGYARMRQYLENLEAEMRARGAASLADLARDPLAGLEQAAAEALTHPRYKKRYHPYGLPKVSSALGLFDCIEAPCVERCAIHQDVPTYAWWIAQGKYDRALEGILERNPLPAITGYLCTHLCETGCTRNNYEEPVGIRMLKRFAAERGRVTLAAAEPVGKRVAVIGGGPSGLAAACFLARSGVQVALFEARDRLGGMCALAPAFRLPPEVVQADVARIAGLGVEFHLDRPITAPPEELLQEFDAVYLACGLQRDARLEIPGIEGKGVYGALDLLWRVAQGERPSLGERVLVIGGGNTAMDAARTARRLTGWPATLLYRRTRAEMPADAEEVADLLAEGNELLELVSPHEVLLQDGRVAGLVCIRNELGEPGPDGRRRPVPISGSEFTLQAAAVIIAIGQRPGEVLPRGGQVAWRENGTVVVDEVGQAAPGIYAGGDLARGPASIVEACADGRRAAEAICERLGVPFRARPVEAVALSPEDLAQVRQARARKVLRRRPALLPPEERGTFALVEQTLSEEEARAEAGRCLQCASLCDKCVEVCPNRANYAFLVSPVEVTLPLLACRDGSPVVVGEERFRVTQGRQILHIDDLCNECGNCATFCVHQGRPYRDKPRLFLREEEFLSESDNAWYIEWPLLRRREGGEEMRLCWGEEGVQVASSYVHIDLSPTLEVVGCHLLRPFTGTLSIRTAVEMALVGQGVRRSLPFLPVGKEGF